MVNSPVMFAKNSIYIQNRFYSQTVRQSCS
jgi:hypothetical protein